ncbi:MATH/TRAF domain [Arabidopsis suecica]|uniref:MATH/TRAF domain n=1 Tax=Arabidopsis suecica TaxID=45249 RepID=A0A8T2BFH6_ARASU|nr:MATH/TRAF domain [Arabidopsis suecica]
MTSLYRNTSSVVYILFCLFFITSSGSFIRQFTDDFNTIQQQKGKDGPIPNLEEAKYLRKDNKISSLDYKVSASNIVKALRDDPPSSYSLKIESFNSLLRTYVLRFESRPFAAGGYNWRLVVYPSGNWWDTSSGYLSLYVAIDDSTPIAAHQEVHADLRFYIFNNNERKYLTIQDMDVWKFSASKKIWGFPQVLSTDVFKDLRNGYLYDGDQCEFGVDVTIASHYQKSESFSVTESFYNPTFTWTIRGFSTLLKESYQSDVFSIGGRSWYIHVFPNGRGEGKAMSMYLNINWDVKFKPFEKIYARAKLRVLNQRNLNNVERQLTNWYIGPGYGSGDSEIISLADLRDSSKGFVVNDMLKVQVQLEAISSTMYFPS